MIRVLIVADTLLEVRSLASLLSDDDRLEIVEAPPGAHSVATKSLDGVDSAVDVIVFAARSSTLLPHRGPPIVVLQDEATPKDPFGRNVHAWLPFDASTAEIIASILAAAEDLVVLNREQVKRWLRTRDENEFVPAEALTPREMQVLRMLADGLGNKEIGSQLGISDHTAKFHVAQILGKLGVGSRAEAVAVGIRRGLLAI